MYIKLLTKKKGVGEANRLWHQRTQKTT